MKSAYYLSFWFLTFSAMNNYDIILLHETLMNKYYASSLCCQYFYSLTSSAMDYIDITISYNEDSQDSNTLCLLKSAYYFYCAYYDHSLLSIISTFIGIRFPVKCIEAEWLRSSLWSKRYFEVVKSFIDLFDAEYSNF